MQRSDDGRRAGGGVNALRCGVDLGHRSRQLVVDIVLNRHDAEIRIFTVKTPLGWLIGMLEPMIADHVRPADGRRHVPFESLRALGLGGYPWSSAPAVRQARVVAAEGEFGD